jgi:peptide/nickel transport system permease protein
MRRALRRPTLVVGLGLLGLAMLTVVLGPWLAPYDPQAFHVAARLQPPSASFWLGTDQFGRDLLSRVLNGARSTTVRGHCAHVRHGCRYNLLT